MGRNQSGAWHRQVKDTMTGWAFNSGSAAHQYFPLAQLQVHTDSYLKRKGNLTPHERDLRLTILVKEHYAKDVAIAACAHALSPRVVRDLLRAEFQVNPHNHLEILPFLRAIVAANHASPAAATNLEAKWAHILITLSSPDALLVGRHLQTFITLMMASVPTILLPHPNIGYIPRSACTNFGVQLEALKLESKWAQAHTATAWLSKVSRTSHTAERLLDSVVPTWRTWAAWQPDLTRLHLWECLTADQREELKDILALEGPDFLGSMKTTLREGLLQGTNLSGSSICHGQLHVEFRNSTESDARRILGRLLNALCMAYSTSPSALALFTRACVGNPVDDKTLQLLESVIATRDAVVGEAMLNMFTVKANSVRMAGVMQLLPALNGARSQALREALLPQVIEIIEEVMVGLQDKLCSQLQNGRVVHGMWMNLHDFGRSLQNAPWLQPMLSNQLQSLLGRWPTKKDLNALLNLRTDVQGTTWKDNTSLKGMVDAYCTACLTGRGVIGDDARNTVEGLIQLWQKPPDPDRRAIALALTGRSTIPSELRHQCLIQLPQMTETFIRRVGPIVSRDTDMACVNFADLWVSQNSRNVGRMECWKDLLLWMIEQRDSTLLDYTFDRQTLQAWIGWLGNLREIFGDMVGYSPNSPPILSHPLHRWTERLSTNYLPLLTTLEATNGWGPVMRWIMMGREDSETIIPFLDLMGNPEQGGRQPVVQAITAELAPDGSNARDICETLSLLARTTDAGTRACLRVLEVHQNTPEAAETVLAGWFQGRELSTTNKNALEAMATTLRIRVHTSNPPTASLQAAAEFLDDEYVALMAEAVRLESIRLTLKTHDPHRTSALLARLNIEDPAGAGDATANIPASLVDTVERVGEGKFEFSFPLTHLKPLQRTALGVEKSRVLLVRLVLGDGRAQPKFCMHLYPEPDGVGISGHIRGAWSSTDGHRYWRSSAGSSAPDVHFCGDRANRAIYQLSRALWGHLLRGFDSLEAVHAMLESAIDNLAHSCITCGATVGARLWRSTTCQDGCSQVLRKSNLEVQLADLRHDPNVVDLLLSMVHAAAVSGDFGMLPGCPITNQANLIQALNSFPAIDSFQNDSDLAASVGALGTSAEALLSWACTSYRGFLSSATEALKIPSMPRVHQFVLANAAPELEKAFTVHMGSQQASRVVFHGTSLDRLYIIMRQGLAVCSSTRLQRHGAAYGPGIYTADEPSASLNYSTTSGPGWPRSKFRNVRVLLGCELVGVNNVPAAGGLCVIPDKSRIVVRYIFLFPANASAPIARHVAPAMLSAYASLRTGSA